MHPKILIILIFSCLALASKAQKFDTLISKIFFSANLSKADTNLVSVFRNNSKLKSLKPGWIAYPPETKLNDTPKIYLFKFQENPFFNNSFDSGGLTIITRKTNNRIFLDMIGLGVSTFNISAGDSTFSMLDKLFSSYSTKKYKEKGLDRSYTQITYKSKDKTKEIVLLKHKSTINPLKAGVRISIELNYLNQL